MLDILITLVNCGVDFREGNVSGSQKLLDFPLGNSFSEVVICDDGIILGG